MSHRVAKRPGAARTRQAAVQAAIDAIQEETGGGGINGYENLQQRTGENEQGEQVADAVAERTREGLRERMPEAVRDRLETTIR